MEQDLQYIPQAIPSNIAEKLLQFITFESFLMFGVIYAFIIWITMVLWVTMDVSHKSSNIFFQIMSILFVTILWPLWFLLYFLIRPQNLVNKKFLWEVEHNLSILSHMVESSKKGLLFCPKCSKQISHVSKVCPKCKQNLEKKCNECQKILLHWWKVCPFCSHKVSKKKKKKNK